MKFTATTLRMCMDLAEKIGTVSAAHLYSGEFITVEGKTHHDGKPFSITMNLKKEEETDGNSEL